MSTEIILADYGNTEHAKAIGFLMNSYARDPFGGGSALPGEISENIAHELGKRDYAFTLLCFVDGEAVGLTNCFEMFSTFACKPIVNIHDVVVRQEYRGRGLSTKMLQACEQEALKRGCVKLTLEVLSNNEVAKSSYQKFGFGAYQLNEGQLNPELGHVLFWQKTIN